MVIKSAYSNSFTTTDKSIREVLLTELNKKYAKNHKTAIIPEFSLPNGAARIDIAVVNGIMHGYELKSDFDNLLRLQRQIEAYSLIFDKVTLVVGKKHLLDAIHFIPSWWGITIAKMTNNAISPILLPIREPAINPEQDINYVVELLWKNEAKDILLNCCKINTEQLLKKDLTNILIDELDHQDLKSIIRKKLVQRFFNSAWRFV